MIDEVTEGVQFVKLCYTTVRHPQETFGGLWNSAKNLKWEDVRKLAFERFDNYGKGGDVARHQAGKDATRVAMVVFAATKKLGGSAADIVENAAEAKDIAKKFDLGDQVKTALDNAVEAADGPSLVKECIEDAAKKEFLESTSEELSDIAQKQGKKLSWKEVLARFKRGNDFNKKAGRAYDYNEIHLGNGKRLDSYVPGVKIVSRKATDLSEIKFETFESYLNEAQKKYSPGTLINALNLALFSK